MTTEQALSTQPSPGSAIPDPPGSQSESCTCDLSKLRYQGQIDLSKAASEQRDEHRKAEWEADLTGLQKFHDSMVDVTKGAIDRSRAGAEACRTAAAAIGVIYTAVLGLAFSADDQLLPPRGVVSAIFLGAAIVLSTAYLASLPRSVEETSGVEWPIDNGHPRTDAQLRSTAFIQWVRASTLRGRAYLRGAILALGFGVAFLPSAFVSLETGAQVAQPATPTTEFPQPPPVEADTPAGEVALLQVKYTAEVEEATEARQEETAPPTSEEAWDNSLVRWFYFIVSVATAAIVLVVASTLVRDRRAGSTSDDMPLSQA